MLVPRGHSGADMAQECPYGRIGETKVVRKRGERMPKNVWSDVVRYAAEECSEQVREITRV